MPTRTMRRYLTRRYRHAVNFDGKEPISLRIAKRFFNVFGMRTVISLTRQHEFINKFNTILNPPDSMFACEPLDK